MGETTNEVNLSDSRDETRRDYAYTRQPEANDAPAADDADAEAARLRNEIEHTRSDMSDTINALQERLAPERVVAQVKEQVKEQAAEAFDSAKQAVKDATIGKAEKIMHNVSEAVTGATRRADEMVGGRGSSLIDQMRQNPLAYGLIGIGIGMLLSNRKGNHSSGSQWNRNQLRSEGDYVRLGRTMGGPSDTMRIEEEQQPSVAQRAREQVSSLTDTVRDKASSVVDRTRDEFQDLSGQARQQVRRASDGFDTLLRDNPMAAGAIALAAGAAVGLALPTTQVESEYMGETRAQFMDKAQEVARGTVEKVQRITEEAGRSIKEAAQHEGLPVGS